MLQRQVDQQAEYMKKRASTINLHLSSRPIDRY